MILKWIPEHAKHRGMYATGRRSGKMMVVTHTAEEALAFKEKGACVEWCNVNNTDHEKPLWQPIEHSWEAGGYKHAKG